MYNETIPFYMDKFENLVIENQGHFVNGKVIDFYESTNTGQSGCIRNVRIKMIFRSDYWIGDTDIILVY